MAVTHSSSSCCVAKAQPGWGPVWLRERRGNHRPGPASRWRADRQARDPRVPAHNTSPPKSLSQAPPGAHPHRALSASPAGSESRAPQSCPTWHLRQGNSTPICWNRAGSGEDLALPSWPAFMEAGAGRLNGQGLHPRFRRCR